MRVFKVFFYVNQIHYAQADHGMEALQIVQGFATGQIRSSIYAESVKQEEIPGTYRMFIVGDKKVKRPRRARKAIWCHPEPPTRIPSTILDKEFPWEYFEAWSGTETPQYNLTVRQEGIWYVFECDRCWQGMKAVWHNGSNRIGFVPSDASGTIYGQSTINTEDFDSLYMYWIDGVSRIDQVKQKLHKTIQRQLKDTFLCSQGRYLQP